MMHQRFALRRRVPGVVHWMKANQMNPAKIRKGMRRKKRNCRCVSTTPHYMPWYETMVFTYHAPWEQPWSIASTT
jgi:hypothetical protein